MTVSLLLINHFDPNKPLATLMGFPPVVSSNTRILILGSFPGAASLAKQEYYAHPQNQFWRLLSALTGEELIALRYQQRLERMLAHEIGLWDAIAACQRTGSLDAAIRSKPMVNDFVELRGHCPALEKIGFNGATAAKFSLQFTAAGFETHILPSSSPAHASRSFEQKLAVWRCLTAASTASFCP